MASEQRMDTAISHGGVSGHSDRAAPESGSIAQALEARAPLRFLPPHLRSSAAVAVIVWGPAKLDWQAESKRRE